MKYSDEKMFLKITKKELKSDAKKEMISNKLGKLKLKLFKVRKNLPYILSAIDDLFQENDIELYLKNNKKCSANKTQFLNVDEENFYREIYANLLLLEMNLFKFETFLLLKKYEKEKIRRYNYNALGNFK